MMRQTDRSRSSTHPAAPGAAGSTGGAVGKRTRVEALPARPPSGPAVQRQGAAAMAAGDPAAVKAAAAHGTSGTGGELPHHAQIQQLFGRHDLGQVRAHVGGPAAEGAAAMGAQAFATGEQVAFGGAPDLHTAAHEAAHVVQQRAGVQLDGGAGTTGDAYERHADQVADRVVAGQSAEGLLAQVAPAGTSAAQPGTAAVQRKPIPGNNTNQGQQYNDHRGGPALTAVVNFPDWYWTGLYNVYYDGSTDQYWLDQTQSWDPVTNRVFVLENSWYKAGDQYYYYDGAYYHPGQDTEQVSQTDVSFTTDHGESGNWQFDQSQTDVSYTTGNTESSQLGETHQDVPVDLGSIDVPPMSLEELRNWGISTTTTARTIIGSMVMAGDLKTAFSMLKGWNLHHASFEVKTDESEEPSPQSLDKTQSKKRKLDMPNSQFKRAKKVESPRPLDCDECGLRRDHVAKLDLPSQDTTPMFTTTVVRNHYKSGKPTLGTAIALPTDHDLTLNLDLYWRGYGDENGGDAIERKLEKHGENSNTILEFAKTAFAFARQNRTRWFYQEPNQVVFHNYAPEGDHDQVKLAVWDYFCGGMVTFYTVEPSKVGGSVDDYMRGIGFKG